MMSHIGEFHVNLDGNCGRFHVDLVGLRHVMLCGIICGVYLKFGLKMVCDCRL
jgi:hypothetical protein